MGMTENITFPKGLPGFEDLKCFVMEEHNEVFSYLTSVDRKEISFVIVDPFSFFDSYEFKASEEALDEIKYMEDELLTVRCIVTLHSDPHRTTANLIAPLLINETKKLAKQIVLHDTAYHAKHQLWITDEVGSKKGAGF